ncbi:MAG TPA: malto-oligosyltrehalose trehalohydrolase [Candidatus Limnocylindrales bacterium]|nr:malto-oligosyltrehalose trehalohydrolase [Candidatus Limnocylindrales bacterium]
MGRRLSVWAPYATRVEAVLDAGRRVAMSGAERHGWWSTADEFPAGTDYQFSVDGSDPRPDPRSMHQPEGVNGPSRTFDPSVLPWTHRPWEPPALADALVYEAHIGTFSDAGTFDGAIGHLDHLVDLGVTHLEVLPINEFPGKRGWGYDGVDLYAAHSAYGGPQGFARLVDACHGRGLAVILDVVYNHLGPSGNYLGEFGPYFTDKYRTPWGMAVNFDDADSDEVRRFFIDNALTWLRDFHVDALRLDAVHAIVDTSALHVLEQLQREVRELSAETGRRYAVIAESDLNDPRLITDTDQGGYGLDAQWSDDFHHALHSVLTGETSGYYADFGTLGDLATTLTRGYRYNGDYSPFRKRRHGRPLGEMSGGGLLGYLQNHDQIGNRATGERSSQLMSEGRLMIGATLVVTAPFVPMLFQGEEWAASTPFQYFTDHEDRDLGRAVTEGRTHEFAAFGWKPMDVPDPQDPQTFERSKLRWEELLEPGHARVLDWHRRLIALRRERPELRDGRLGAVAVQHDAAVGWLWFRRGRLVVAFNIGGDVARLELDGAHAVVLASSEGVNVDGSSLSLPPDSVAILESAV